MPRRGGYRAQRQRRKMMSEINVTPFVDVMLVVLIIFMIAAPELLTGVPVNLPQTAAQALPGDEEEPISVVIDQDGTLYLQSTEIAQDELIDKMRAIAAERESRKVFLRADGQVLHEKVAMVMGALNAAGFSEIGLVTRAGGPNLSGAE